MHSSRSILARPRSSRGSYSFCCGETLGESGVTVSHAPQLGLWVVRGDYSVRFSVANTTEWGTERRSALELIEDALNLRVPTVCDHDPHEDRDVVNGPATEAARDKRVPAAK